MKIDCSQLTNVLFTISSHASIITNKLSPVEQNNEHRKYSRVKTQRQKKKKRTLEKFQGQSPDVKQQLTVFPEEMNLQMSLS